MQIFLNTERLVLRRFTGDDIDNLVELDSDPEVMRFINGGRATPRDEIENDVLPAFLGYYQRYAGYGFWARWRDLRVGSLAGSTFGRPKALLRTRSSSAIDCADRPGGRGMPPKAHGH